MYQQICSFILWADFFILWMVFFAVQHTPMFIATLFTIAETWKQPECPLTDESMKKIWYMYTEEYHSVIKKTCHLGQHGWNLGAYTKWNKSDREIQILCDVTYMWNLRKMNPWKERKEWPLPGTRWWGNWGKVGRMVHTSSCERNKFWDLTDGIVTIMVLYCILVRSWNSKF